MAETIWQKSGLKWKRLNGNKEICDVIVPVDKFGFELKPQKKKYKIKYGGTK